MPRPVKPVRQLLVRTSVLVVVLAAALLFASQVQVGCQRTAGRVQCQVDRGVTLPWLGTRLAYGRSAVDGVREVRCERRSPTRTASSSSTQQPYDVLVLTGNARLENGWCGASAPVRSFLRSTTRSAMVAVQPIDPRGWMVSRALLGFAALVLLDSLLILLFGNARLAAWVGPAPDPEAPLPETMLAKIGPVLLLLGFAALFGFFAFGYRFVGPFAEHKVAALHQAVEDGDLGALQHALASGVAVHAVDTRSGRVPLHTAARWTPLLEHLLARGADPNAFDLSNATPLHAAASYGDSAGVSALLEHGAEPDAMDDSGWTPLRRAVEAGQLESAIALLAAGSDPRRQGPHGWTPLHTAAAGGELEIVERLLDAGADPDTVNENGHRPWDLASTPAVRVSLERPETRDQERGQQPADQADG